MLAAGSVEAERATRERRREAVERINAVMRARAQASERGFAERLEAWKATKTIPPTGNEAGPAGSADVTGPV